MASADYLTGAGAPHVERYLETNGEDGFHFHGTEILILFTTGRKSQTPRSHALIFRTWGDNSYLVVVSKHGTAQPPAWFLNLQADPNAEVQIKDHRFAVRARVASEDEKPEMCRMTEVWSDYDEYTKKTSRVIPVIVLERPDKTPPRPTFRRENPSALRDFVGLEGYVVATNSSSVVNGRRPSGLSAK
jgi:deazaflavin-dependent oxidoreductase (nitroreductase family)